MSSDIFKISGKKFELSEEKLPEGVQVSEWRFEQRPGGWIIAERDVIQTTGGIIIERRRFMAHEFRGKLATNLGGIAFTGDVSTPARGGAAGGGSEADLVAQFPGKVRKILVAVGDAVEEGKPLLLVEAMKMEFAVKAPYTGVVKKINVTEGQQLTPGVKFLDLEAREVNK